MKRVFAFFAVISVVGVLLSGCGGEGGKKAQALSPQKDKLFQTASAEIKANWEKATAAIKTNDYVASTMILKTMRAQPGITPEQTAAIDDSLTAVSDTMYDAINKGDEKAKAALEELRKVSGR